MGVELRIRAMLEAIFERGEQTGELSVERGGDWGWQQGDAKLGAEELAEQGRVLRAMRASNRERPHVLTYGVERKAGIGSEGSQGCDKIRGRGGSAMEYPLIGKRNRRKRG